MCQQHNTIRKGLAIENAVVIDDSMKFDPIWDTRDVPAGAGIVTFFPPQPQASGVESNYESIPLPGNHDHLITGGLIKSTRRYVTFSSAAEATGFVNSLSNAQVLVLAESNNKQLAEAQLEELMNLDEVTIEHNTLADGATDEYVVGLPAGGVQKLTNSFVIAAQQTFKVQIRFEDAGGIPADTLRLSVKLIRAIPKAMGE